MLSKKDIELLRHYSWFVEHPTPEQLESGRLIPLAVETDDNMELDGNSD